MVHLGRRPRGTGQQRRTGGRSKGRPVSPETAGPRRAVFRHVCVGRRSDDYWVRPSVS